MSHNLKVGDLALTLVALSDVEAGSVVELVDRIEKGDLVISEGITRRTIEAGWVCKPAAKSGLLGYPERYLMPLRGDFAPERQKSQEVPA